MNAPHTNDTNDTNDTTGTTDTNVPAAAAASVNTADTARTMMRLSETKALFAGIDATAEKQARAADAQLVQTETNRSIQFLTEVLLPRLVEARTNGHWFVGLQDSLASSICVSSSTSASTPIIIHTPDLAIVVGVLLEVLPPSWVLCMNSAAEAKLLRLPAVNERVWAETRNQVARCRVVERSPADIDMLTVEWPWKKTERLRFDFRSGIARGSSNTEMPVAVPRPVLQSPSASSIVAPVDAIDAKFRYWQTFKSLIPSPEQVKYDPGRCFSAVFAAAQGVVDLNDKVRCLSFLLRNRPFVVRDSCGHNFPAIVMDVKGDGAALQTTEALFHFAGYHVQEDRWLNLDSNDIVASLPHTVAGLGPFMLAMAPTAKVMYTIGKDGMHIVEHHHGVDSHVLWTSGPEEQIVFKVTATTFAVPCCGQLKANVVYPSVCGMNRFALEKMFQEEELYMYTFW